MTDRRGAQLTFVGVGFSAGQITLEAIDALRRATRIYYYHESSGPVWFRKEFPAATDLFTVTQSDDADRRVRYEDTAELLLAEARKGHIVACAFYGSPALMACIPHLAVQRAREEGLTAQILPGISCFESLICDLAGHPIAATAVNCRAVCVVTASEYLCNPGWYSPLVALILLSASVVNTTRNEVNLDGLRTLTAALARTYGPFHEIVIYHAREVPLIRTIAICRLPELEIPPEAWTAVTILVPPLSISTGMMKRAFVAGYTTAARKIEQQRQQIEQQRPKLAGPPPPYRE
jgi:Tetrapyrrole (Corrin/Porphyrin) Methylases